MRHRFSHSTSPLRNLQVILLTTGLAQLGSNVAVLDSGATACTVKSEGGVVGLTPSQSVFTGFDQSGRHLVGDADGRIHLFAYEPNSPSSGAGTSSAAAAFLAAARGFLANCCSACLRALWSTADALTGSLSVHPGLLYELGIFSLPFRAVPHQNSSAPIIRQPWTFGGSPADCFRSCFPPRPVGALRTPVRHPVCTLGIFSLPFRAVLRQSSSALVLRQPWTFGGSTAGCFWPCFSHYGHELRRSPSGEREFSTRGASLVAYGHSSCSPSLRLSGEPFRAILAAFSWLNSTAGCL